MPKDTGDKAARLHLLGLSWRVDAVQHEDASFEVTYNVARSDGEAVAVRRD